MTGRLDNLLSEGDLTTDGLANEVVRIVGERPEFLPDLVEALASPDPAVRGHAADALEKVARAIPSNIAPWLPQIVQAAQHDEVAMVRWHLAMVLGHLANIPEAERVAAPVLLRLLEDRSAFVRSWAITSLCLIARARPARSARTLRQIGRLTTDPSPAVAKRAQTAVRLLADPEAPFPNSWIKRTPRKVA